MVGGVKEGVPATRERKRVRKPDLRPPPSHFTAIFRPPPPPHHCLASSLPASCSRNACSALFFFAKNAEEREEEGPFLFLRGEIRRGEGEGGEEDAPWRDGVRTDGEQRRERPSGMGGGELGMPGALGAQREREEATNPRGEGAMSLFPFRK